MSDIEANKYDIRLLLKNKKKFDFLFNNDDHFEIDYERSQYDNHSENMSVHDKKEDELYDGKFGKFYKYFNLQVLKNKMWEIIKNVFKYIILR